MSFSFDAPEDVQGEGNYLSEPGTFHQVITDIKEGQSSKGNPIDGFTVEVETRAGTLEGCEGKIHSETIFAPDMSKSEAAQLAARRRIAAFLIATDLMKPEDLGKSWSGELSDAVGRQIVQRLARKYEMDESTGKYTKETKFLQIDYAAVYHVDDPEVANVPKDEEALKLIDSEHRHDASYFEFKKRKGSARPQATAAASSVGNDDFSDL